MFSTMAEMPVINSDTSGSKTAISMLRSVVTPSARSSMVSAVKTALTRSG